MLPTRYSTAARPHGDLDAESRRGRQRLLLLRRSDEHLAAQTQDGRRVVLRLFDQTDANRHPQRGKAGEDGHVRLQRPAELQRRKSRVRRRPVLRKMLCPQGGFVPRGHGFRKRLLHRLRIADKGQFPPVHRHQRQDVLHRAGLRLHLELKTIDLSNITTIGTSAFEGCKALEDVVDFSKVTTAAHVPSTNASRSGTWISPTSRPRAITPSSGAGVSRAS